MVFRSHSDSPRGSLSPYSSHPSPPPQSIAHAAQMASEDSDQTNRSARSTPNRRPVDLPRTQLSGKGGCWTCRLRRKKCDEQREGDSCKTCIRLTIECLGWGPKRPDWMRDKQAVEAYKANIKAQLTRAGLIRGQPRLPPNTRSSISSHPRSQPYPTPSAPDAASSRLGLEPEFSFYPPFTQPPHRHNILPGMPSSSTSPFHQPPANTYNDTAVNALDLQPQIYPYSPHDLGTTPLPPDPYSFDFSQIAEAPSFDLRSPSSQVNGFDHVIYYFEHVRKIQYIFAGNALTNITYALILENLRGPVSNAVCALASLHYSRMRIAQGLELPGTDTERSQAAYFHDEAVFQLTTAKQQRGTYTESDAIAALHLVSYSQMSGCKDDWQRIYAVACEWMAQTGLLLEDSNPRQVFDGLTSTGQLIVRIALWIDVFASLTAKRSMRYLHICRKLFGDNQSEFWTPACGLRMDSVSGCPDEAMLCLAETAALAHWKSIEKRNGSLSYRELIRRGDAIEQRLRQRQFDIPTEGDIDAAPLHPNLMSSSNSNTEKIPNEVTRPIIASIFRETALLYLHTILNDAYPGVSDIQNSVSAIFAYLNQLPPSEADRGLTLPMCLAGAMTDDSLIRAAFTRRLSLRDENIGNLLPCRVLMETVWQKRDRDGGPVDLRETALTRSFNLLLI